MTAFFLAVDTSGETGSVALAQQSGPETMRPLGERPLPGRAHSVMLLPAIAGLLQEHSLTLASVDAFAVVRGPGSFTGLRVGLSAVKGLAEVTGKPVLALSRLAVLASMRPEVPLVHAVFNAGRGEFYHGVYRDAGRECVRESVETADALRAALLTARPSAKTPESGTPWLLAGPTAANALTTLLRDQVPLLGGILALRPTAQDAFPLALWCWREKRFADVATLDANYLRRSDAELFSLPHLAAAHPQAR
jgi:tRNA threonylcarbamoyladenosine biosynthesis protein TsaB